MYYFNDSIVSMILDSYNGYRVIIYSVVYKDVVKGSLFFGDIVVQLLNWDSYTLAIVLYVTVAESSVRNIYVGMWFSAINELVNLKVLAYTTESGEPAVLLSEPVSDDSKCMQNIMFPPVE